MKKFFAVILVALLTLIAFGKVEPVKAGNTWFVSSGGSGDACTQAAPCQLDYAVQMKSSDGDTILAHSGIYKEEDTSTKPYMTYIYKSLTLIGSCDFEPSGSFECDTSLRNSTIYGELERKLFIVQGVSDGMSVSISGFTFLGGNGEVASASTCVDYNGSPVTNCGGGIFAEDVDSLEISDNTFIQNTGSMADTATISLGGAVYAEAVKDLNIKNNTFDRNLAALRGFGYGGGIFVIDSGEGWGVLIENNKFDNNRTSSENDPTLHSMGAGVFVLNSDNVLIGENIFEKQNNLDQADIYGSAIYISNTPFSIIYANTFRENYGLSTIRIDGTLGAGTRSHVLRNQLTLEHTTVQLEIHDDVYVSVMNNFIGTNGNANSCGIWAGGGATTGTALVNVALNTIADLKYGLIVMNNANLTIEDNIFAEISGTAVYDSGGTSVFTVKNNLYHNVTNLGVTSGAIFLGDPLLVDVPGGDYHIQAGSAAIDKVLPLTLYMADWDIDNEARGLGVAPNNYDVGADEFIIYTFLPLVER